MQYTTSTSLLITLLASAPFVAAHGAITSATGDAGGQGSAIGIVPGTPRTGTTRNPFQQDTTRFRGANKATCGQTLGGGENDIQAGTAKVLAQNGGTLPQITPGGQIMMTLHQVNSDGAGSYKCMIDSTGTGAAWTAITVTQNLPGNAQGRNKATQVTDQPLVAAIPAGQACTGTVAGQSNVCMVRCENPARAGPFGGCVPVQMAGGNSTTTTATNGTGTGTGQQSASSSAASTAATGTANTGNTNGNTNAASSASAATPSATGTAKTGNGNGNAKGNANSNQKGGNGNASAIGNANGNANTNANAGTAKQTANGPSARKRQALTNDDQQEEVDLLYGRQALTDDDQQEEIDLLY